MSKKLFLAVAVVATLAMSASSAFALNRPRLSFFKGGGATIGWSNEGGSSPGTGGDVQSIRIQTFTNGSDAAGAYTYGANETKIGMVGGTLSAVDRLAFDSKGYLGAGAPRISLITDQGNFFLSAYYCNDPTSGGWRRSVFADRHNNVNSETANCTIYGPDDGDSNPLTHPGNAYTGWSDVLATWGNSGTSGTAVVQDWFLIQEEGPAVVYVDRLTIQDFGWIRSGKTGIINCNVNLGCAA
jgi:hypothetical protein